MFPLIDWADAFPSVSMPKTARNDINSEMSSMASGDMMHIINPAKKSDDRGWYFLPTREESMSTVSIPSALDTDGEKPVISANKKENSTEMSALYSFLIRSRDRKRNTAAERVER